MKPNVLYPVRCTEASFYRLWLEFLAPFHKLTPRERDVAARLIRQWVLISSRVKDHEIALKVLWSNKSRKDMRESLGLSPANFQMQLKALRATGIITETNELNKSYIPQVIPGEHRFVMSVLWDWSADAKQKKK